MNAPAEDKATSDMPPDGEPDGHSERKPQGLCEILDRLADTAKDADGQQTSVQQILEEFGNRTYGPLLLVPGLLALLPIVGAIPGVSMATAALIMLVGLQMIFRQRGIWLPKRLREVSISQEKLQTAVDTSRPYVAWIDKLTQPRLEVLTRSPLSYGIALLCVSLAATMFPLAFVPFGVAPPAAAIVLLALGLTAHDGLLVLLGTALCAGSGWFAWYVFNGGLGMLSA